MSVNAESEVRSPTDLLVHRIESYSPLVVSVTPQPEGQGVVLDVELNPDITDDAVAKLVGSLRQLLDDARSGDCPNWRAALRINHRLCRVIEST